MPRYAQSSRIYTPFFFTNSISLFSSFMLHTWLVGLQGLLKITNLVLDENVFFIFSKSRFQSFSKDRSITLGIAPHSFAISSNAVQCGEKRMTSSPFFRRIFIARSE